MSKKDYNSIAAKVVSNVGGAENITHALHCATRLRLNLKDNSKADLEALKNISGVLGTMQVGEQLQVIIGPDVAEAYDALMKLVNKNSGKSAAAQNSDGSLNESESRNEKTGMGLTPKSIGAAILDGLSGTMGPVIPAIVACAFFKMLTALLGPDMLGILAAESDIYKLFTFVGDAAFYFFPCIVGYTAAMKFQVTPVLGILMGAILIHPALLSIVEEGNAFTVFGIPMYEVNYTSTIIPVILSVWAMSYVERFFNKYIPSSIRNVFAPAFTIMAMLPVSLCILAPAGAFLGNYIVAGLLGLQNVVGFVGIGIIAGLYPILVMTGMHMVLIMTLFQIFATQGWDGFAAPALVYASFSVMGVAIGAALRLKNKEQKSLAIGYAITAVVAGTSEPTIYGICTKYKRPFIGLIAGGFIGGVIGGIMHAKSMTLVPATNFTSALAFLGGESSNFIMGIIAAVISTIAAAIVTYLFGFKKDEADILPQ